MAEDLHSIRIDEEKCTGCVLCMKACPTKAIRLRKNKAVITGERCVDCGECYRVCPQNAVIPLTTSFSDLKHYKCTVALPSATLYTQFGWEVMPNQILLALHKIGFDHVYDGALMCEMVSAGIEEHLKVKPEIKPRISTYCPAVIRLITSLYPNLTNHLLPVEAPRELAAKRLRREISRERNIAPDDIGIIHITACPARMISIQRPIGLSKSYLDGAISVRDIYGRLLDAIKDIQEDVILHQSSGVGLGWAISGGLINGISMDNCLAVSGVNDVIEILDDVESGKLRDIEYLECLICPDGCVGGPLNVENRHFAKTRAKSLVKMFGERTRVSRKMISRLHHEGFFTMEKKIEATPFPPLDEDPVRAIEMRNRMEEIIPQLGGRQCGACGAPDCRTLARDIVLNQAKMDDCVFVHIARHERGVRSCC